MLSPDARPLSVRSSHVRDTGGSVKNESERLKFKFLCRRSHEFLRESRRCMRRDRDVEWGGGVAGESIVSSPISGVGGGAPVENVFWCI